jgi:hypothetical protein
MPFFYSAYFPSYRNYVLLPELEPINFPHRNKQLWSSGPTSTSTSRTTETILTGSRTQDNFWELWPLLFNLLFKTYNFVLSSVLLPCFISEIQNLSARRFELRTVSRGYGHCFYNLLFETNNSGQTPFLYHA